jgi:hypothetical protein
MKLSGRPAVKTAGFLLHIFPVDVNIIMTEIEDENVCYIQHDELLDTECIHDPELERVANKLGALITILHSTTVNPSYLFLTVMRELPLQSIYMKMCTFDTPIQVFGHLLGLYPKLTTSKIVRERARSIMDARKKYNRKKVDRKNPA